MLLAGDEEKDKGHDKRNGKGSHMQQSLVSPGRVKAMGLDMAAAASLNLCRRTSLDAPSMRANKGDGRGDLRSRDMG